MARGRKKPTQQASAQPQPGATPLIYEASLGPNGAVIRMPPPVDQVRAVAIRQNDGNVVVCGTDKRANSVMAGDIEYAANGFWRRCKPHTNAGPNALPHYQPDPRGQTIGHTFYETDTKHPL
jgi:hypothetical protein